MDYLNNFNGNLYCERHSRLTCLECLHSINSIANGLIPQPQIGGLIRCPQEMHSVHAIFQEFLPTAELRGFHQGLSPDDHIRYMGDPGDTRDRDYNQQFIACDQCGLDYYSTGGEIPSSHPSHVGADGKRYVVVTVEPFNYERSRNEVKCTANFISSYAYPEINVAFECTSRSDGISAQWDLDNAEIAALVQLFRYVEDDLVPHRQRLVAPHVFTNSEYFAGQAWRFQLVVRTAIDRETLDFLLDAHQLNYSVRKRQFIQRDSQRRAIKRYPGSQERHRLTTLFLGGIQRLAELGIQVYWLHANPYQDQIDAKRRFLYDPNVVADFRDLSANLIAENAHIEDDLQSLSPGPSDDLPSEEEYLKLICPSPSLSSVSSSGYFYRGS